MTEEVNEKQFTINYGNTVFVENYNDNLGHSKEYYVDENVNQYWSFENDAQNQDNQYKKKFMTLYIQNLSQCRRCKMTFEFNNRLHKYLKESECLRKNFIAVYVTIKAVAKDLLKSFAKNIKLLKSFAKNTKMLNSFAKKFFANNFFNIAIIKEINVTNFHVMQFIVDLDSDLSIDYDFRDWTHIKVNIILSENVTSRKECLNIEIKFILIDRAFFKKQTSDIFIWIMIVFLIVRGLDINKHQINEYALIFIYIKSKDENGKTTRTCFRKEVHIVNDLKINMLIDNDVMKLKNINVSSSKRIAYIENCKIIISVKIKSFEISVIKSIHLRKTTIISFHSKILMKIHHLTVFDFRNFFFEFNEIDSLIAYIYLMNAFINEILFWNEFNRFIKVSRNYRLRKLIELKYINAYYINDENDFENRDLAARRFRSKHQKNWFKRIIAEIVTVFATMTVINNVRKFFANIELAKSLTDVLFTLIVALTAISAFIFSETIFFNDVIIYNFDDENNTVTSFRQIIEFFFNL